jgi:hypothetical protein
MNLNEIKQVLLAIEARDRRPFPTGAAEIWLEDLQAVDLADAMEAVTEHFRLRDETDRSTLLPGTIRRRALELRARRQRAAIQARPVEYAPPNDEYRAALARLARAVGNPERLRRRPDTAEPTLAGEDAQEFEARRRRYLDLLERVA